MGKIYCVFTVFFTLVVLPPCTSWTFAFLVMTVKTLYISGCCWLLLHRWHRVGSLGGLFGDLSCISLRLSTCFGGTGACMALSYAWVPSSVCVSVSRAFSNVTSLPFVIHFLLTSSRSVPNTKVSVMISFCISSWYPRFRMRSLASVMKVSNGCLFCLRLRR